MSTITTVRSFLVLTFLLTFGFQLQAHDDRSNDLSENTIQDVEIISMTRLIPSLREEFSRLQFGDLIVFDLDNTVFREAQMLGSDEWYMHQFHEHRANGVADPNQLMHPLNLAIKGKTRMVLMENGIPRLIRQLQMRGVYVIGLTARHPDLAPSTLRHLFEHRISFERSRFPDQKLQGFRVPGLKNEFLFQGGVAFTDGSPKGVVLREVLRATGVLPKWVMAIDDRIHHVHTFVEALQEVGIPGRVIHYLRHLELRSFDADIANIQLRHFKETGRFLSDRQARVRHKRECQLALQSRDED